MQAAVILRDPAVNQWLRLESPREIVIAQDVGDVLGALEQVEAWVEAQNGWAAGFISYEAAPAFDAALTAHRLRDFPLVWFGLYDAPTVIPAPVVASASPPPADTWQPNVTRETYEAAIARIRDHIARGDTYQVNYTLRLRAPFTGEPFDLFAQLVRAQPNSYAAFLDGGRYVICSASPELFFRRDGAQLTMRPMKGTAPRGRFTREDRERSNWLRASEKNRAENIMIVDMARSDLGRIAETGSVRVTRLWDTERYPTVWQMTTTVAARTQHATVEVLRALFPCASITGAPKHRTMQIIRALESEPRRVYTGAIGFLAPGRRAQFSVAIRTALVDRERGCAEYGVGGGIVWDSDATDEWNETQHKARILTVPGRPFSLIESLRWTPDAGYWLLEYHLRRLRDSADYFDMPFDPTRIQLELARGAGGLPRVAHKARLLLAQDGSLSFSAAPLETQSEPVRLVLARAAVDSNDRLLFHKTTRRAVYDAALAERGAADDVLLYNERGEITETCAANIVAQFGAQFFTPPIESGLLGGVYRAFLLDEKRIAERVIHRAELAHADALFRINSVRGWQRVVLST